jgi:hypothetical protein
MLEVGNTLLRMALKITALFFVFILALVAAITR